MESIAENELVISNDKDLLQVDFIHSILKDAYWCKGIPLSTLETALSGSLCFGAYIGKTQIAFARIVTDGATFAWLCDVIVDPKYQGKGISKILMKNVMAHPQLQGLRRICLATKDAHGLYSQFKFKVTETPQNWMEVKDNNVYLKKIWGDLRLGKKI